jgi:hypothetical protein
MVTNNNTWTSIWANTAIAYNDVPDIPVSPPIPTVQKVKLKSVRDLLVEEQAYLMRKRGIKDPYSDPDVFI